MELSREDIANILRRRKEEGRIMSKRELQMNYGKVNRAIGKGELYQSSFEALVCTDVETRDLLEEWHSEGRVMDMAMIKARTMYTTAYAVNIACANGDMLRFPDFGKSKVLYIK